MHRILKLFLSSTGTYIICLLLFLFENIHFFFSDQFSQSGYENS